MCRYEIKFYSRNSEVVGRIADNDSKSLMQKFKIFSCLTEEQIHRQLSLKYEVRVGYMVIVNNTTGDVILTYNF